MSEIANDLQCPGSCSWFVFVFLWVSLFCLLVWGCLFRFFFRGFCICVKIVVTSLWAKAKGLFGCLILFVCLFGLKKTPTKRHTNQTNPIPQKYSAEKEKNNAV